MTPSAILTADPDAPAASRRLLTAFVGCRRLAETVSLEGQAKDLRLAHVFEDVVKTCILHVLRSLISVITKNVVHASNRPTITVLQDSTHETITAHMCISRAVQIGLTWSTRVTRDLDQPVRFATGHCKAASRRSCVGSVLFRAFNHGGFERAMGPAWARWPMLALLLLCWHCQMLSASQHDTHNSLERINVLSTTILRDNSIKLDVSTTKISKGSGQWIEVRF